MSEIIFRTSGATGHSVEERQEHDYYATDPIAAEWLLKLEPQLNSIWECSCGGGHLAKVFDKLGKLLLATDLIDYGYSSETCGSEEFDFLKIDTEKFGYYYGDICTNPPFKNALEFAKQGLKLLMDGRYLCLFLKIQFLEGKERKKFFEENPPIRIWVTSSRIKCAKNGIFDKYNSSVACYAWFVWQKGYKGDTVVKWFN